MLGLGLVGARAADGRYRRDVDGTGPGPVLRHAYQVPAPAIASSRTTSNSPPPSSRYRVRRGSTSNAVSPACINGTPDAASNRASPASRCSAHVVPGSAKNTTVPTHGRRTSQDATHPPHHHTQK